jgi:hypothetical protein
VSRKSRAERDIVQELHEDARWSMWTNSIERWRGRLHRGSISPDPGIRTFMLAALLVAGVVVGAIVAVVLLFTLGG